MSWPGLAIGDGIHAIIVGRRAPVDAFLLDIGERGELSLAIPPRTWRSRWPWPPHGFWRPLLVGRHEVRALWRFSWPTRAEASE